MALKNDPVVTVYITNYNYEKYLEQAIRSVLAQTFDAFELIVIDDGSSDRSRDIIARYGQHQKVRTIMQNNKGLNAANNVALRAARGRYLIRLDADDYLDENALLVMTHVLEGNPEVALVYPDYFYVDADGRLTGQERRRNIRDSVTLPDQPAHGACTLIRKSCLLEVGGYSDDLRCQDGYEIWLKVVDHYPVRNVNLPLFYHRRHGANLTEKSDLILETRAEILRRHAESTAQSPLKVLAVLLVRGQSIDPGDLSLEPLGERRLMDWTADAVLGAPSVARLVVSSQDDRVLDHAKRRYGERVGLHRRDFEPENVHSRRTLEAVLAAVAANEAPDAILEVTAAAPFRGADDIEHAVNNMRVFDLDAAITVVPESHFIYHHDGHRLAPVGKNPMKSELFTEQDYLFRQISGTLLVRRSFLLGGSRLFDGRLGHVVLSAKAAHTVHGHFDLSVANMIAAAPG